MENLQGATLMVLAMAGFALEDMFIKRLSESLPVGQLLILLGFGGMLVFGTAALLRGHRLLSRDLISRPVLLRNFGEVVATIGFISALALTPLSSASAILQATPLAVTLGAALFLGEPVGWRRWSAIALGFLGVVMIIRPGLEGFRPASLFAVLAVAGLAIRDLATRATPRSVTTLQLASYAFGMLVPTGVLMLLLWPGSTPAFPSPANWRDLGLALIFGLAGYYAIVAAMRVGEVAYVTPFRYTRLVFALIIGAIVFAERPDVWTLAGAALIVATGLYSVMREAGMRRRYRP